MTLLQRLWIGPDWSTATPSTTLLPRRKEGLDAVLGASTRCESVEAAKEVELPFPCYELTRNSGCLAFWDESGEDVYSFDGGEAVGD